MGYHISIVRTRDGKLIPITVEEVRSAIQGSSGFRAGKDVRDELIVEIVTGSDPFPCLWFADGGLWTKNPDEPTVDGMCELADLLGARVRGDELETYRSSSDCYHHPDDADARAVADKATKEMIHQTKRRGFVMHCCIFGSLLLVGLIVGTCSP